MREADRTRLASFFAELQRLYCAERLSAVECAKRLGCSKSKVGYWVRYFGWSRSLSEAVRIGKRPEHRLRIALEDDEIERLYVEERLGTRAIARQFSVAPWTVLRRLHKRNVKLRSLSEQMQIDAELGRRTRTMRIYLKSGYVRVWVGPRNYRPEHVVVWEQAHGRKLPKGWQVHHLNGVKDDNRLENLFACAGSAHRMMIPKMQERIRKLELEVKRLRDENSDLRQLEFLQ